MGKKSGPTPPPAPDPYATAQAQGEQNRDTAIAQVQLNNMNQYTPQGNLTYEQTGTWADGTPRFSQTFEYSPEQQALYDQQNQIAQALSGLAGDNIQRVADVQGQDFNFDNLPALQGVNYDPQALQGMVTQLGGFGNVQTGFNSGGGIQSTFGTGGPLTSDAGTFNYQNQIAGAGDVTRNVEAGQIQQGLDYSGLDSINTNFDQTVQAANDAVYNQLASRLDPQYQQLESDMRQRLINSGISENSEAFRREMDNFARQRTDAYSTAANQGILTGLQAQQQGFGQSLAARQQGVSEINNQGAFANSAQAQQFGQGMANAGLNNQAQAQVFGQNAAQLQAFNQAQQAGFDQSFANAQLNNAAQGQQYQQNLGAAAFGNEAQAQQFGQNMQQAAFGNAAQDQQFQQALAGGGFTNQALAQQSGLDFQNQLAAAQFNNALRQQGIEEQTYLRNLPLNDIAALLGTGGGVQNPTFSPFAQAGIASPDLQGAIYANYNAQMQQYNQAQANRSAGLGSIFGALGSLGGAAIMSDRRVKHNIKRIGTLANGLATYVFSYLGEAKRHFGVMAQEALNVVPEAVGELPSGIMYVDYRKVW